MDLKPVKTRKIYEEIVDQIQTLIANGNLKPGDRLLSERHLAEKLKVSRVSVREALRSLEILGFIETRTGGGSYIKSGNTQELTNCLAMYLTTERDSLLETFELRRIFESASARLAAERASCEEIEKIGDCLEKMNSSYSVKDSELGREMDTAFHYAIANASQNRWLRQLLEPIYKSFDKTVSAARQQLYKSPKFAKTIMEQHKKIFNSIREKNPDLAEKYMREHVEMAESSVKTVLGELQSKPARKRTALKSKTPAGGKKVTS